MKILLIEDDAELSLQIRDWLMREHYAVETIATGNDAMHRLKNYHFDLAILDWELPELSGIEILKAFRQAGGSIPVLMLTGKSSMDEKEQGLDTGADDYLTKPFNMKELSARIRALLRRPPVMESEQIPVGGLLLSKTNRRAYFKDEDLDLLPKEYEILELLARHREQSFSAETLLERIWPSDSDATIASVRTYIKNLRKKLACDPSVRIRTIHSYGYQLETF